MLEHNMEKIPQYEHIEQNYFSYRRHKKQKAGDIAICECSFDYNDPDTACGEGCLNVLTSTECTPGYCPCGLHCRNQRFQKCQYAKTKLFHTTGYGWGLLADEHIKSGEFIIEYCGEVISCEEAQRRSEAYENQGVKDAFIISLNSLEYIDATKKGSLARFINHSCEPNCVTRKWNVLGEMRVGIFAKRDIPVGTELAYNYNFEWYGGAKVRCRCGAPTCTGFLGAKSRGFLEDTYLWEDGDERYSTENIPLYDSAEDEASYYLPRAASVPTSVSALGSVSDVHQLDSAPVDSSNTVATSDVNGAQLIPVRADVTMSHIPSSSSCRKYRVTQVPMKWSKHYSSGKPRRQVDAVRISKLFPSKEAQEEVLHREEMRNKAASKLASLYEEIRPKIEEHERDSQDSVDTCAAENWIGSICSQTKAEFDLYSCIAKNIVYNLSSAQMTNSRLPSEAPVDSDHS